MSKENIEYRHGSVDILKKRVTWNDYKNNYHQTKVEYSEYGKNKSNLVAATLQNYQSVKTQSKNNFYRKFTGMTKEELGESIAEFDMMEKFIRSDILESVANKTLKEVSDDKAVMQRLLYSAIDQLGQSTTVDEEEAAKADLRKATEALDRMLNVSIPNTLVQYLNSTTDFSSQDVAEALYFETNDPGALTSYLNSIRILESLKNVANVGKSALGPAGKVVFEKYQTQLKTGLVKEKMNNSGTLGDLSNIYRHQNAEKIIDKPQVIGNTIGKTTGAFFEAGVTKGLQELAANALLDIITKARTVGAEGGKTDVIVEINGKSVNLQNLAKKNNVNLSLEFNSPELNLSLKQGAMKKGSTFDNSTIGKLYSELAKENAIDTNSILLYHYYQLFGTEGWGADKEMMSVVNRYVTSKLLNKAFGAEIDYIVFKDKTVPLFEYIDKISTSSGKQLKMVPRLSTNAFTAIEGTITNIKNG